MITRTADASPQRAAAVAAAMDWRDCRAATDGIPRDCSH